MHAPSQTHTLGPLTAAAWSSLAVVYRLGSYRVAFCCDAVLIGEDPEQFFQIISDATLLLMMMLVQIVVTVIYYHTITQSRV